MSSLLKAMALLVLVTVLCLSPFCSLCVFVCVCVLQREREKSNCWHLTALKVALGFVLFTATWSFHSPPQKKPFSISLRFLSLFKGAWVCMCICARVCVCALCLRERSRASFSVGKKSLFPPKERARRQCQCYWLELATWEGRRRQREGGHLSVKGRGKSLMWSSLVSFSRPRVLAHTHMQHSGLCPAVMLTFEKVT